MADLFRGLFGADRALEAFVQTPESLERSRARFNASPPWHRSQPSGTTTLSHSADGPSEAQLRRDEHKFQLEEEHRASLPYRQFKSQYSDELARLLELDRNQTYQSPPGLDSIHEHADANVKMRWIEQGIWKDEWNDEYRPGGRWKHEDPPKLEDESNSDTVFAPQPHGAGIQQKRPAKSDEEVQQEQREREASRPYHQFIFQVSKERERIQEEMKPPNPPSPPRRNPMTQAILIHDGVDLLQTMARKRQAGGTSRDGKATASVPPDINTTAYERVKGAWIKWRIWDTKWGVFPGMSWKHEQPLEEMLREALGEDPGPGEAGGPGSNQREPTEERRIYYGSNFQPEPVSVSATHGTPETNGNRTHRILSSLHFFEPDQPSESSQRPGPRGPNISVQEAPPVESSPFAGNEVGNLPLASDSHDGAAGKPQNTSSPARRMQPVQTGPLNVKPTALKPVRSARVSKTRKPGRPARSGQQVPAKAAPAEAGLPAKPDVAGLRRATDTPVRRSRRLNSAEDNKPAKNR